MRNIFSLKSVFIFFIMFTYFIKSSDLVTFKLKKGNFDQQLKHRSKNLKFNPNTTGVCKYSSKKEKFYSEKLHFAVKNNNLNEVENTIETVKSQLGDEIIGHLLSRWYGGESLLGLTIKEGFLGVTDVLVRSGVLLDAKNSHGKTPLMLAIEEEDDKAFALLLSYKSDCNIRDKKGKTALILLSEQKEDEGNLVELLLKQKPKIDVQDIFGVTALLSASMYGHLRIVKKLVQAGADIELCTMQGETPLMVSFGNSSVVLFLLTRGANPNVFLYPQYQKEEEGNSVMGNAIFDGCPAIIKLLIDYHADVHIQDVFGNTLAMKIFLKNKIFNEVGPLQKDDFAILCMLLGKNIDINIKNKKGETLLMMASFAGDERTVKLLLQEGAEINAENSIGETALCYAIASENESLIKFLLKNGADVNVAKNKNKLPLFIAQKKGMYDVVKILLEHGADINAQDNQGNTLLGYAVAGKSLLQVHFLLTNNADVNIQNKDGVTPLHIAVSKQKVLFVDLLFKHNADVNFRAKNGVTPLMVAALRGYNTIVKKLLLRGADVEIEDNIGKTVHDYVPQDNIELQVLLNKDAFLKFKNDCLKKAQQQIEPIFEQQGQKNYDISQVIMPPQVMDIFKQYYKR